MDFSLSDEQRLLKESVERFVANDYGFEHRKRAVASDEGFFRETWKTFAELGWLGLPFAEEHGGYGGTPVETMLLMEGFGRGLVAEPYLATVVLGGGLVAEAGSTEQKTGILPAIAAGDALLALAHAEADAGFNPAFVAATAREDGAGWVLDGAKCVVLGGGAADWLVVSARTGGGTRDEAGITLFLVDATAAGISRRAYPTVDGTRAADIAFDGVRLGADAALGPVGGALPALERALDHATIAVAAEALGAMEALLAATVEYAKTRRQFGRPIGSFQALQHRLVDMYMETEQARSMVYAATLSLGAEEAARKRAVSEAKVQVGEAARFVGQQAIQIHGGIGMTHELMVGHYFKRLTAIGLLFGNADWHLDRLASL